jgi:two-component system NtrC family sensor kinase
VTGKISLQTRILLLVTIVTVLLMSIIVWFDSYSLRKSVEETYISQLNGMTTAINGRYEESHSIEDVQQIFDYIEYKNDNVLQITLYGEETVLASTDRERIGLPSPPNLLASLQEDRTLVAYLRRDADGIPKNRLTAPLKEDGMTIGAIELLLNTSDSTTLIQQRIEFIMIVGCAVAILLLLVLWLIIRKMLIHPLMNIRAAAVSVKQGAPYKEISLDASQEINEVASAFNDMVHNLEGRYKELQQAMDTIRRTQKQLVQSEKMVALGSLVAGVAHEINTPLGIGVTAASFLDEKSKDFASVYRLNQMKRSDLEAYMETVRDATGMIQSNLQRASELVKSFKQVAVDQSVETRRKFNVKQYINEVLISLRPNLKKTRHSVSVHGSDDIFIVSHPGALSQIITNLIMNSIIHAYDPKDEGHILIAIEESDRGLVIRYDDDGKGMPEDVLDQIFNPFFTTNRGGGGTGLGMHIVYNLVDKSLNGMIRCESKVGAGTAFTIQIPMIEGPHYV